jgi:hypothetical protein
MHQDSRPWHQSHGRVMGFYQFYNWKLEDKLFRRENYCLDLSGFSMIQRSIEEMVAVDASFENTGAGGMGGLGCAVAVMQGPSGVPDDRGEPVIRVKGHNRAQL